MSKKRWTRSVVGLVMDEDSYSQWNKCYKPLTTISRFMGLSSFEFGPKGVVPLKKRHLSYNIFLIILLIGDFFYQILWLTLIKTPISSITDASHAFSLAAQSIIAIASTVTVAACAKHGLIKFKSIIQVDAELIAIGIKMPYNLLNKCLKAVMAFILTMYSILLTTDYVFIFVLETKSKVFTFSTWITMNVLLLYSTMVLFQFIYIITEIGVRFHLIEQEINNMSQQKNNQTSQNIKDTTDKKTIYFREKFSAKHKIETMNRLYNNLIEACIELSMFMSATNLLNIAANLVAITAHIYTIVYLIMESKQYNKQYDLYDIIYNAYWTMFRTMALAVLCSVCSFTSSMANNLGVVIHKLIAAKTATDAQNELQNFSLQIVHRKLKFSVCGFFNIDLALFHAIIRTAATYLIILIQFKIAGLKELSQHCK